MPLEMFSQLGIGLASLAILSYFLKQVVAYFIDTIEKKDIQYEEAVKLFNKTMNNHIKHETKARQKETIALNNLAKTIGKFDKKLSK